MSDDVARLPAHRDWISSRVAVAAALAACAATVLGAATLDQRIAVEITALLVAMMYGVYFGFAIAEGTARDLAIESLFIGVGCTTAVLALEHGPGWLAVGLILHGIWDLLHHPDHRIVGTPGAPGWYVPFCAVYDFTAAVTVLVLL
ncbi:hypothetical protein [Nocardia sp. NPDC051570]|uniref:hypothetical protein n=1 Tax=Nocardia sp. NPDC051570 TaxID=3364324 RepID=UPI00379EAFAE